MPQGKESLKMLPRIRDYYMRWQNKDSKHFAFWTLFFVVMVGFTWGILWAVDKISNLVIK